MFNPVEKISEKNFKLKQDTALNVLHLDDDNDFLVAFKRLLEKQGPFKVESASCFSEALQKIVNNQYDAIVSDYQLTNKTGLDFLSQLKKRGHDIPFILLTRTRKEKVLPEALNLGTHRYFNKNENDKFLYLELADCLKKVIETKKAELELRESEKKFRTITACARDGIVLLNTEGKIKYWNRASEKIFGYTSDEVIDKNLHMLIAQKPLHEAHMKGFSQFKEIGEDNTIGKIVEVKGFTKSKKIIFIEMSLSAFKLNEKWFALAIIRDNTERKTAWKSLEETFNELVKINEKLTVVGRLTRHDARNKLALILNNTYLAKKQIKNEEQVLNHLESVDVAVDQMAKIFEFAKTYEMLGIEELTYNNVKKSFNEAVALLSETEKMEVKNECSDLTILSDSLLRQLFYNLIHNSIVHGKTVTQIKLSYNQGENGLNLIYEDNGTGIPENEKTKIFDEGFGKGTGYGLYLIQKICENYNWTIQEKGIPTKGAKFVINIPKTNNKGKILYKINKQEIK